MPPNIIENPDVGAAPGRGRVALRIEAALLALRPHAGKLQALMLLVFATVVLGPLVLGQTPIGPEPFRDAGAISGMLLWGVWLPAVMLTAVIVGRAWCGLLCPMGAGSEWMSRIGLNRTIPGWLRWTGLPLVSFLAISVLNEAAGADENATAMAILFGSLFIAALAVGFLFGRDKRAWCRHACPIGMTLGVLGRLSALTFLPKRLSTGGESYTEKTPCPTMIDLKRKTESRHCVACGRCVAPRSNGGLEITLRRPGSELATIARANPKLVEVLFLFSAIGIAAAVLLEDLPVVEAMVKAASLDQGVAGMVAYFAAVNLATVAVLAAVSGAVGLALARSPRRPAWRVGFYRVAYSMAPLTIAALLLCMCGILFETLEAVGLAASTVAAIKGAVVVCALVWSGLILSTSAEARPHLGEPGSVAKAAE